MSKPFGFPAIATLISRSRTRCSRYVLPGTCLALFLIVAGLAPAMAGTITTGPNGQINWLQSQNFNLPSLLPSICYGSHGSGSGCSESMQQQLTQTESATLSFTGAPAGFNIAGTQYSLSGVQMSMTYSAAFSAALECNGQDLGRACEVWGTMNSFGRFSFANGPSGDTFNLAQGADVSGPGWDFFIIYYPVYARGWHLVEASTSNQIVNDYHSSMDYFESLNTLDLTLTKSHTEGLAPLVWQDYRDAITERSDYWSGTVNLQYTFSPTAGDGAAPVASPEPGTFALLIPGMMAVVALRRRTIRMW